jgi:hypothetical protein
MTNKTARGLLFFLLVFFSFSFVLQQTLTLGKKPKALPQIDTTLTNLTWQSIVEDHYKNFTGWIADSTYDYRTSQITKHIFSAVYGWYDYDDKNKKFVGFWDRKVYNAIVKPFYHSQKQQMALYKWIRPSYINSFKSFPQWRKTIFINMLADAKKYIAEFDYEGELKILNETPNRFAEYGPKGLRGDYHNMEIWIFRRVNNGDMTLEQMSQWVEIFEQDLDDIK